MALVDINFGRGRLKVKLKRHMRRPEREREVRVVDFGFFIVAWWSAENLTNYQRDG